MGVAPRGGRPKPRPALHVNSSVPPSKFFGVQKNKILFVSQEERPATGTIGLGEEIRLLAYVPAIY